MNTLSLIKELEYYGKDSYYNGKGEPPSKMIGLVAKALNIRREYDDTVYRRVFSGFDPNGVPLCENAGANHRPGWDLTFSAPKSVSILFARSDEDTRKAIQATQQLAVEDAFGFIEQHAAFTRRGKGGHIQEKVRGLIGATFEHCTSRAQDPQLHTHCLIANLALRKDGSWGTLESKKFFLWQMASGAIYRSSLANGLRELGFEVEVAEGHKHFEVKGVDQSICQFFSKRAEAIRAQMAAMGVYNAASKVGDAITLNSRRYKQTVDRPKLFASWQADMDRQGFKAADIDKIREPNVFHFPEPLPLQYILDKLIESKAVFSLQDIFTAVGIEAQFNHVSRLDIEDTVRELLNDEALVRLGMDSNNNSIYTTKAMLAIEQALIATADAMHANSHYRLDAAVIDKAIIFQQTAQGFTLSNEQTVAVHAVCQSSLGIIQGKAGAGKSTSLQALRLAYESNGMTVRGATVARKAAQQLQNDTGIASGTLASLLNELRKGNTERFKDTVFVVDEAGLMSTPDVLELVSAVHKASAKLVLVGEQEQLDAISHGGSLRYLSQRLSCARITTIRRQREVWAKTLVNDLRSGNAEAALVTLQSKGLLHVKDTANDTREALVNQWAVYTKANPDKSSLVMAQRWKDVKPLNDLMRIVYQERGLLGSENVTTECVVSNRTLHFAFSTGERVRLTKNDYTRNFTNGQQGTVIAVTQLNEDVCITIALDDGRTVSIKKSEYCDEKKRFQVVQAYASTVYSAQGATIDGDTFTLYTTSMDRSATYVAGSRAKDKAWFFVNGQELDAQCWVSDNGDRPDMTMRLEVLARNMKINRHKCMATEYLDELNDTQREREYNRFVKHDYGFT
jgi:conjugative relaxase-like TrwC/TraI family protein